MLNIPKQLMMSIESYSESDNEKQHSHSEDEQLRNLKKTLNEIYAFLLSLVISYVVSRFKLLQMYWYKYMVSIHTKLKLVI